ncbi:hypothetical protein FA13DRAFT_1712353 [Coprinellus micaceus]|uniref:Uncharacterized protein n=1 Tax=Coprinellus micaceus TaxID=71717 RepID=A0A4Y7T105_COPMI|nr:hypothetical protein FA13DRAFT_1712353 [Coprinellus micaceus]
MKAHRKRLCKLSVASVPHNGAPSACPNGATCGVPHNIVYIQTLLVDIRIRGPSGNSRIRFALSPLLESGNGRNPKRPTLFLLNCPEMWRRNVSCRSPAGCLCFDSPRSSAEPVQVARDTVLGRFSQRVLAKAYATPSEAPATRKTSTTDILDFPVSSAFRVS